ncbi:cystatin domain-containing protein [Novosphingobium sp.]|uniref:cystatin domain-containing protein n=1 Tax=Novosphingobium sp. TaxID=1874826 RepID=UPI002600161E|nr:cystatin domain-containing protein [Novosphingobium sp.]MCC6926580.1 hypothetical protein [Novosphingobium sp.]
MRKVIMAIGLALAPPLTAQSVVGGWSEVPGPALASEVGPAARYAVAHLPKPHGKLKTIVGAERQVVAGMNYRMLLVLSDGKRWRVQVWKKLDGTMQLTHFKRVK